MGRKASHQSITRSGQFFKIYQEIFQSDAFRSLDCRDRALLLELHSFYVPGRNEDVFLSIRDAKTRLMISPDRAGIGFKNLMGRGFIRLTSGCLWQQRISRTWRLTFESYGNCEPTDDWREYKIEADPNPRGKVPPETGQSPLLQLAKVVE